MPSETPEPTQEQRPTCEICMREKADPTETVGCYAHSREAWAVTECCRLGYERLAAEAAPLREEIERLTKEVKTFDAPSEDEWSRGKFPIASARAWREAFQRAETERDEARDWVRRLTKANTLTCVYCGHEYPPGTPSHGVGALTDHIKTCAKHPLRAAEAKVLSLEAEIEKLNHRTSFAVSETEALVDAAEAKALTLEKQLSDALSAASRALEEGWLAGREAAAVVVDLDDDATIELSEMIRALAPPAAESQENQQQLSGKGAK